MTETEIDDPLLKGKGYEDPKIHSDFYQNGFEQLEVTMEDIRNIGAFIHELSIFTISQRSSSKKLPLKGVTNDHHRHLNGAIFAFGSEKENVEWKEHSASSLREMISLWESGKNFKLVVSAYCEESKREESDESEKLCEKITNYYGYFTGVTHHQVAAIVHGYRFLEDVQAENGQCQGKESYKKVFKKFFVDLKKIINIIGYESA
jgi:hypothetical protein